MRKTSSQEAKDLGILLSKKGITHEILTISAQKVPQKNIESNLRDARYKLLQEFCVKNEIEFLFLGHHLGDVAENFLIRLFRGSGLDGLSTMGEVVSFEKIKLVRPLLDFEKDDLKEFLIKEKVQWFEDETNEDEKFLRNKVRKFLGDLPESNLIQRRIKNSSDEISEMRDFFDDVMWRETKDIVSFEEESVFINHKKFCNLNDKIALKILAFALMKIGKKTYKPRREKLERFYQYIVTETEIKPRNFYGCMLKKLDKEKLVISPE